VKKPFLLALESVAGEDLAQKISKFQITIHKRLFVLYIQGRTYIPKKV